MSLVTLQGIEKKFGDITIIKSIDLKIKDGEFLVLLGPSGCGKSTTMRMIAGLETISKGKLFMDDKDVTNAHPRDRNVAMVFQNYALYPHMTVADNIGYPLKIAKIAKKQRAEIILESAKKVDLLPYLKRYPRDLSGGQRQRVALARALVRNPEVFLLDEPLSNLDAKLRVLMRSEIKHLQRNLGVTMIYVTHDQIEAMTLADRVVLLSEGIIQQVGTPDEIYEDPDNMFVASFIGSPPMNFINGKGESNQFIATGVKNISSQKNGDITLGFRAEDVLITENSRFSGTVFDVEPTGEATYLVIKLKNQRVIIRVNKKFRPELNSTINFDIPDEQLLFFNTTSGERIR